jgi:hypothetical protein
MKNYALNIWLFLQICISDSNHTPQRQSHTSCSGDQEPGAFFTGSDGGGTGRRGDVCMRPDRGGGVGYFHGIQTPRCAQGSGIGECGKAGLEPILPAELPLFAGLFSLRGFHQ